KATGFGGGARDLGEVSRTLRGARLVTLTGPGGVGKSRLALEIARHLATADPHRFPAGVWRVELAPITDGSLIVRAIAACLGVRDVAGRALTEALRAWLGPKQL